MSAAYHCCGTVSIARLIRACEDHYPLLAERAKRLQATWEMQRGIATGFAKGGGDAVRSFEGAGGVRVGGGNKVASAPRPQLT